HHMDDTDPSAIAETRAVSRGEKASPIGRGLLARRRLRRRTRRCVSLCTNTERAALRRQRAFFEPPLPVLLSQQSARLTPFRGSQFDGVFGRGARAVSRSPPRRLRFLAAIRR